MKYLFWSTSCSILGFDLLYIHNFYALFFLVLDVQSTDMKPGNTFKKNVDVTPEILDVVLENTNVSGTMLAIRPK